MKVRVSIRTAGHVKNSYTFIQLLQDVSDAAGLASRIVETGFLDYRTVPVVIDLPPSQRRCDGSDGDWHLHCELAAVGLRAEIEACLGVDPRMLSGRLFVVVELNDPTDGVDPVDWLRGCGYRVDLLEEPMTGNGIIGA